jgi:hypothetical protein
MNATGSHALGRRRPLPPIGKIRYRDEGSAEHPVVVLSSSLGTTPRCGTLRCSYCWSGFRVIRYEHRGHGEGPRRSGPHHDRPHADLAMVHAPTLVLAGPATPRSRRPRNTSERHDRGASISVTSDAAHLVNVEQAGQDRPGIEAHERDGSARVGSRADGTFDRSQGWS